MKSALNLTFATIVSIFACSQAYSDGLLNTTIAPSKFYVNMATGLSINSSATEALPQNAIINSSISGTNTPQFSVGIGYYFNDIFRLGTSTHFISTSNKVVTAETASQGIYLNTSTASHTALVNIYFHLTKQSDRLSPYLTTGIGGAFNKIDAVHYVTTDTANVDTNSALFGSTNFSFAWQLGAGMHYKINNRLILDLNYQYLNHGKVSTKGASIVETATPDTTLLYKGDDAPKLSFKNLVSQQISLGITVHI